MSRGLVEVSGRGRRVLGVGLVVALTITVLAGAGLGPGGSSALAADPPLEEELWTKCNDPAAVQCSIPRGVAADPATGQVVLADSVKFRIVKLNARGEFLRTWGWDVAESGPGNTGVGFEICVPAQGDTCKAGVAGAGSGQFGEFGAQGVALDSAGSAYVVDHSNRRVEKFDFNGNFILMFGGNVNKTKEEAAAPEAERNLCPIDPGDVCKAGVQGTAGQGQFGAWKVASFIAVDPADKVYVGDAKRIQRFDTGGHYIKDVPLDPLGQLKARTVQSLAADFAGNLYVSYNGLVDIRKLNAETGEELTSPRFKVPSPSAVAVDSSHPAGHVFAFGPTQVSGGFLRDPIFEFDSAGNEIANWGIEQFNASTGLAFNLCPGSEAPGNLYVSNSTGGSEAFLRAYGTEPIGCFRGRTLPATDIAETAARLNGTVNPEGEVVSDCFFEYGTSTAYSQEAQCNEPTAAEIGSGSAPVPVHADVGSLEKGTVYHFRLIAKVGGETEPGADEAFKTLGPPVISEDHTAGATFTEVRLKALVNPEGFATKCSFEYGTDTTYGQSTPAQPIGSDRSEHVALVTVAGLAPGTTYHWRLICENASDTSAGNDHSVATYRTSAADAECANQAFRIAVAASLPDCRGYEMVSPIDKDGADIINGLEGAGSPGGYVQASPDGERITYSAAAGPAFGDARNHSNFNQYLASREAGGWSNHGIHPPLLGRSADPGSKFLFGFFREFMAFTPDLCSAWMLDKEGPPPTADGQVGYPNTYRLGLCEGDSLEALAPAPPALPDGTPFEYVENESVQGVSGDGRHALFVAQAALTPEAAAGTIRQVYDRFGGENHLVSVLPGGVANPNGAVVGSGWSRNLEHAVSQDGSRVYWTADSLGTGKLFLRLHPEQGVVADECGNAAKACTLAVSNASDAFFWSAATDGSKALFSTEGSLESGGTADLREFDLRKAEEGQPPQRLVVSGMRGVAGAADDLSHIYFVSDAALTGEVQGEGNSEGDFAIAGKPNLYLEKGGARSFVATLLEGDLGFGEEGILDGPYNVAAYYSYPRATRVSPDGARIVFQSRAPLTGFDNTDANSGKPDVEVFTYEAGGALECVSCNPSGARPRGRKLAEPYRHLFEIGTEVKFWAAAWIPTWEHPLHESNVLSADGGRLFFNSNDALLPRDANGAQDVYQWEVAGRGKCDSGDANYFPQNGGCLDLISSGGNSFESEFWEASQDGDDVFFTTEASLMPKDPGLIDLYDARVGGGEAEPIFPSPCEGEACQNPPPPPAFPTPASGTYNGPGNPPHKRKRHRKHRRHKHKHKHRSNHKRRTVAR